MDRARLLAYITGTVDQDLLLRNECLIHYHAERTHQGKDNVLLFPTAGNAVNRIDGSVGCMERSGGMLKYYHLEAAWGF